MDEPNTDGASMFHSQTVQQYCMQGDVSWRSWSIQYLFENSLPHVEAINAIQQNMKCSCLGGDKVLVLNWFVVIHTKVCQPQSSQRMQFGLQKMCTIYCFLFVQNTLIYQHYRGKSKHISSKCFSAEVNGSNKKQWNIDSKHQDSQKKHHAARRHMYTNTCMQNSIEHRQEWFAFRFQKNSNVLTRFGCFTQATCWTLAVCCWKLPKNRSLSRNWS